MLQYWTVLFKFWKPLNLKTLLRYQVACFLVEEFTKLIKGKEERGVGPSFANTDGMRVGKQVR